ncbi:hypothetical protein Bca52824_055290 [Brassica carinata]|uniref:Uncharacterized protein n=1 Tax=Brassica carinata TaxID=52824 RepID=A0A8X7ULA8_BRACI|nr:hypothetical protein Bca52824_055290 [Brassica carinata]
METFKACLKDLRVLLYLLHRPVQLLTLCFLRSFRQMADGLFISESSSAKKTSNQSFPERYLLHSSSSDWFSYIHSLIVLVLIWILKEC